MHSWSGSTSAPGSKSLKQREALGRAVWGQELGSGSTGSGAQLLGQTHRQTRSPWRISGLLTAQHLNTAHHHVCVSAGTPVGQQQLWEIKASGSAKGPCRRRASVELRAHAVGNPQAPAWPRLGCCLCSSLTSARGLELSARTWEHFEEALPVQPAQVPPGVSPAPCLSQSSGAVKSRFECTWYFSLPTPNHRAGLL